MESEDDNLPKTGGTENAQPSTMDDNSNDWDYDDSDDDQSNDVSAGNGENEGEADEAADASQEAEDGDESAPEDDDKAKAEPKTLDESVIVELPTGVKVPLTELKNGYLRQQDYTAKTTQVSEYRRSVEAEANTLKGITEVFANFIAQQIPEAPPPALAYSDPSRYTAMKATHEAAVAQLEQLIAMGRNAAQTANTVQQTGVTNEVLGREKEALAAQFPEIKNQAGHQKFFDGVFNAAKEFGVSPEELAQITDHRYYAVLHYAKIGKRALAAKEKAQEKVKNVPPIATPKKAQGTVKAAGNRDAMRKLAQTGSLRDAMAVDFD